MSLKYTSLSDIPKTVNEARRYFNDGRTKPLEWRRHQLLQLNKLIEENEQLIIDSLFKDLHKSKHEAILTEIKMVTGEIAEALEHLEEWMKPAHPSVPLVNKLDSNIVISEPLGVVLIIGAWNYPYQVTLSPLVGALAAGNAVILKPSEVSENSSIVMSELIPKYMDKDAIKVVNGGKDETSALLNERFDHILYTGGSAVARIIMKAASAFLTPVTLELGGKNPCYIHSDANLSIAARRLAWAKLINSGQTCLAPDYILLPSSLEAQFIQETKKAIVEFYGENVQKSPDYARIVNSNHFKRLQRLMQSGDIALGGEMDESDKFIAPTLLTDVAWDAPIMQQEIFGPLLPIFTVDSVDEAIARINTFEKPLALYVFTDDKKVRQEFISRTSSGGMCINDCLMQAVVCSLPFGGVGESGTGAYHGKHSFDCFSHRRSLVVKNSGMEIVNNIRYAPYSDGKLYWLEKLLFKKPKTGNNISLLPVFKLLLLSLIVGAMAKTHPATFQSVRNYFGI